MLTCCKVPIEDENPNCNTMSFVNADVLIPERIVSLKSSGADENRIPNKKAFDVYAEVIKVARFTRGNK